MILSWGGKHMDKQSVNITVADIIQGTRKAASKNFDLRWELP